MRLIPPPRPRSDVLREACLQSHSSVTLAEAPNRHRHRHYSISSQPATHSTSTPCLISRRCVNGVQSSLQPGSLGPDINSRGQQHFVLSPPIRLPFLSAHGTFPDAQQSVLVFVDANCHDQATDQNSPVSMELTSREEAVFLSDFQVQARLNAAAALSQFPTACSSGVFTFVLGQTSLDLRHGHDSHRAGLRTQKRRDPDAETWNAMHTLSCF